MMVAWELGLWISRSRVCPFRCGRRVFLPRTPRTRMTPAFLWMADLWPGFVATVA